MPNLGSKYIVSHPLFDGKICIHTHFIPKLYLRIKSRPASQSKNSKDSDYKEVTNKNTIFFASQNKFMYRRHINFIN